VLLPVTTISKLSTEAIAVPKASYDVWVKAQIAATPIEVADRPAWNAMLAAVPAAAELFAGLDTIQ